MARAYSAAALTCKVLLFYRFHAELADPSPESQGIGLGDSIPRKSPKLLRSSPGPMIMRSMDFANNVITERRRRPRTSANLRVEVSGSDVMLTTRDLGLGGMGVYGRRLYWPGQHVHVRLQLPNSARSVPAMCRIVNLFDSSAEHGYGMSMQFLALAPKAKLAILRFIASARSATKEPARETRRAPRPVESGTAAPKTAKEKEKEKGKKREKAGASKATASPSKAKAAAAAKTTASKTATSTAKATPSKATVSKASAPKTAHQQASAPQRRGAATSKSPARRR